jgi:hypothetical protein
MNQVELSPPLIKFLEDAKKEELEDLRWLLKHPEYEHRPVSMEVFLTDERFTSEQDRPRAFNKKILTDVFDKGNYDEVLYIAGIGSGKSYVSSMAIAYILYKILCLKDPQKQFGFATGTKIAFLNIATNFSQAKDVVFSEIKNRIDNNPWFQMYYSPDPKIKSLLRFGKNLHVLPVGSNEESPLGYNIFGAIIDEASFHVATKDKDYAEEAYHQIKKRIRSRFLKEGKLFIITSPRYVYDFAEKKFNEDESPSLYKARTSLWAAKAEDYAGSPKFDLGKYLPEFKGIKVPVDLESDFKSNPERAMRDYGAQPSLSIQGFFRDPTSVDAVINKTRIHPIKNTKTIDFYEWFLNTKNKATYDPTKRYIHVDLGLNKRGRGDAAGIAMGKFDGWQDITTETGKRERRPKIYIDYMEQITSQVGNEIRFEDIRRRIYKLREMGYNIAKVTFDGWQSIDSVQILEGTGFKADFFSVDRTTEAYYTLKAAILEKRIDYYNYPVFIQEVKSLEEIRGTKIDHPRGGSKDVSDAVAGVTYHCAQHSPGRGFLGV